MKGTNHAIAPGEKRIPVWSETGSYVPPSSGTWSKFVPDENGHGIAGCLLAKACVANLDGVNNLRTIFVFLTF